MLEWIIVVYPRVRDVFIDGVRAGVTNQVLLIGEGTWTIDLGAPRDYRPRRRTVPVSGTSATWPLAVPFEPS